MSTACPPSPSPGRRIRSISLRLPIDARLTAAAERAGQSIPTVMMRALRRELDRMDREHAVLAAHGLSPTIAVPGAHEPHEAA